MDIKKLCVDFDRSFEMSLTDKVTFSKRVIEIMEQKHWYTSTFEEKTELTRNIYSDIKSPDYMPTMRIVISICVGLELDIFTTTELLRLSGLVLVPTNRVHYAYNYIIEKCRGMSIRECNEFLEGLEIEETHYLGSHSNEKRKRKA